MTPQSPESQSLFFGLACRNSRTLGEGSADGQARAIYAADLALIDDCDDFFSGMGEIARARQDFNSPTTRPEKPGLYEVLAPIACIRTGTRFYAIWNGAQWGRSMAGKERALACDEPAVVQNKAWREVVAS